jgi:hypothetical protein
MGIETKNTEANTFFLIDLALITVLKFEIYIILMDLALLTVLIKFDANNNVYL